MVTRRLKMFLIPDQALGDMMHGNVAVKDFPSGAKIVRADYDTSTLSIQVIAEHESFQASGCGWVIPRAILNVITLPEKKQEGEA